MRGFEQHSKRLVGLSPQTIDESDCKSTFVGHGSNIAGSMKDADNDDFVGARKIIDRVFLIEDHTQIVCEMGTGSTGEWELQCLSESGFGAGEKISGE
jgi:hypothetical protein